LVLELTVFGGAGCLVRELFGFGGQKLAIFARRSRVEGCAAAEELVRECAA